MRGCAFKVNREKLTLARGAAHILPVAAASCLRESPAPALLRHTVGAVCVHLRIGTWLGLTQPGLDPRRAPTLAQSPSKHPRACWHDA